MKEVKDKTHQWKDILCSWIVRINTVKMSIQTKAIYRFNAIPIKIPKAYSHRTRTNNFKICMETQKTSNSQSNLKKNRVGGIMLPDFRLYYKAIVIKTVWYWHKNRNTDQENKIGRAHV